MEGRGSAAGNPGSKVPLTRWRPHMLAGGFGEGAFLSLGFPICQARVRSVLPAEVGREVNAVPRAPRAPKPGGSLCGTASPGESRGPARCGLSPLSPLPPSSRESGVGVGRGAPGPALPCASHSGAAPGVPAPPLAGTRRCPALPELGGAGRGPRDAGGRPGTSPLPRRAPCALPGPDQPAWPQCT